ncbi:MAG: hypothetical protein ABJD07_04920 [Gemmatimonadaceae bacterium]
MTGPSLSTHVGAVGNRADRIRSLQVSLVDDYIRISLKKVDQFINDAREAEKDSGQLAEPLAKVSEQVALQEDAASGGNANASAATMMPSLTISETVSRELLKGLRRDGSALRGRLSERCVEVFKSNGFLTTGGAEPALTFVEDEKGPHILWDLMYDGGMVGAVNWESFWGFRVPIAHWVFEDRTPELRLRDGLFGGIHEEYPFSILELDAVAQRVQPGTLPRSVADYFKEFVREGLAAANLTDAAAQAWIAARPETWLRMFLIDGEVKPDDPVQWKYDKIVEMLKSTEKRFDLLHFACHSAPGTGAASRSEMTMHVGGEKLTFDVGSMMSDLRIKMPDPDEPGPFVFLNACRSVKPKQPFQPPPFATAWINDRGALAVISAICPVPDFFAHAFAIKYYDFLLGRADATFGGVRVKGSLAGALLATRRYFMEEHRNPLGLAYLLYTSPNAHLTGSVAESGP